MVEQKISLDFQKNGIQRTVYAKQGENASRDVLISLVNNGDPVDVSAYTVKIIYPDGTHSVLTATNPIKTTIPQQMCLTTGEKICEIQITRSTDDGIDLLYSPQFRVLVEGSILGASGSSEPIGDPTTYEPALSGATVYSGTSLGTNAKLAMYDSDIGSTRLISPSLIQADVSELQSDIDSLAEAVEECDYTKPYAFFATATTNGGAITGCTLNNDKTIEDVQEQVTLRPVWLYIYASDDEYIATFRGYCDTESDSGMIFGYDDSTHHWLFLESGEDSFALVNAQGGGREEIYDETVLGIEYAKYTGSELYSLLNTDKIYCVHSHNIVGASAGVNEYYFYYIASGAITSGNYNLTIRRVTIDGNKKLTNDIYVATFSEASYTQTEKTKLSGIASGAEVNVQSDWNQSDNTADDYIKNKPSIPAAQIQSDWSQSDNTAADYIKNKPTIPSVPVTDVTVNGTSVVSSGTAAVVVPTAGTIASGNQGYATGGDVYTVVGNVEAALAALIGGES